MLTSTNSNASKDLILNSEAKSFLKETAKWTYFFSILGFIGVGLFVLLGVFASVIFSFIGQAATGMDEISPNILGLIYIAMAALYFFPVYYLYNFSKNIKAALQLNDNILLNKAFENLKSHYKFIGIFTLVIIASYVLSLLFFFAIGVTAFV